MATKPENASITNTFGSGARPIQSEPVCVTCKVVELYGFYNVVMEQFSGWPLFLSIHIQISAIFGWFFQKMAAYNEP